MPIVLYASTEIKFLELFLGALGKDSSVSGRSEIWHFSWTFIQDRFWFGYGYGAFWEVDMPWLDLIEARMFFTPHYSHNALLEVWLDGGIVLVAILSTILFAALLKSGILASKDRYEFVSTFPLVYLITYIIRNITESIVLVKNSLLWVLFIAIVITLSREVILRIRVRTETQK